MLIPSLVLHQVKDIGAVTQKEINSECRTLAYVGIILTIRFSYGYNLALQKINSVKDIGSQMQ